MSLQSFWKSYRSSLLMLSGIVIGGLLGWLVPASAVVLAPVGKIFMNLLFVIIVPMILFSVSSAVCSLNRQSALARTMLSTAIVILLMALLLSVLTYVAMLLYPPFDEQIATDAVIDAERQSWGDLIVSMFTVSDFTQLFSIRHILPMMVVAMFIGIAASHLGNQSIINALERCQQLTTEMMNCLMVLAPIGLGCYFADMMANSGSMLLTGFGRVLGLYLVLTLILYLLINPLSAKLSGVSLATYWREMFSPSLMAVSTLSSSACIPTNIKAAEAMGTPRNIAEAIVSIGTQFYKQGSIVSCATKVAFVIMLMGEPLNTTNSLLLIIGISVVASVIVGAVPTGAGTAELFICSALGADPSVTGLLIVISTLVDMPGTLLNVNGNTVLPVIINRITPTTKNKEQ